MHDIGKVGTPDAILLKPGKLTNDEFEIMKLHASTGYEVLCTTTSPMLQVAAPVLQTLAGCAPLEAAGAEMEDAMAELQTEVRAYLW